MVDFPAPVLPTTPIFWPFSTSNDKSFKTISVFGRYLKDTWMKLTLPSSGQLGLFYSNFDWQVISYGTFNIFMHLSAFTMLLCKYIKHFSDQVRLN